MMQHNLSHREQEVLRLIAYENTNDEIAEKLYISFQTVKTHRKNLLEKLSVKNTAGLVRRSFELGLLDLKDYKGSHSTLWKLSYDTNTQGYKEKVGHKGTIDNKYTSGDSLIKAISVGLMLLLLFHCDLGFAQVNGNDVINKTSVDYSDCNATATITFPLNEDVGSCISVNILRWMYIYSVNPNGDSTLLAKVSAVGFNDAGSCVSPVFTTTTGHCRNYDLCDIRPGVTLAVANGSVGVEKNAVLTVPSMPNDMFGNPTRIRFIGRYDEDWFNAGFDFDVKFTKTGPTSATISNSPMPSMSVNGCNRVTVSWSPVANPGGCTNNWWVQVFRDNQFLTQTQASSYLDPSTSLALGQTYAYTTRTVWHPTYNNVNYRQDENPAYLPAVNVTIPQPPGRITGKVVSQSNFGVQGINVTATLTNIGALGCTPSPNVSTTKTVMTNVNGDYEIKDLFVGISGNPTAANYDVVASLSQHDIEPANISVQLTAADPTESLVNFTDNSVATITGTVFDHTGCGLGGALVYSNSSMGPPVNTASDGTYVLQLPGIGQYTLKSSYKGEEISQTRTITTLSTPNVNFTHTLKDTIRGFIGAGCQEYIGQATIQAKFGTCVFGTVVTNSTGYYQMVVPRRNVTMKVTGISLIPNSGLVEADVLAAIGGDSTITIDSNTVYDVVYRRPLTLEVEGLPPPSCSAIPVPILETGSQYYLNIYVWDKLKICPSDTGTITINNFISGTSSQNQLDTTLTFSNGVAQYFFRAGEPMLTGDHRKSITVTANVGNRTIMETIEVVVIGGKKRGASFITAPVELPFMILRDPPGDQSSSWFESQNSFSFAQSFDYNTEEQVNVWAQAKLGADIFGFKIWGSIDGSLDVKAEQNSSTENVVTVTNLSRFSTSTNPNIIGTVGDVYVGAAINFEYSLADVLEFDLQTCSLKLDTTLYFNPSGFATDYLYTEGHIKSNLIPDLMLNLREAIEQNQSDSVVNYIRNAINVWQQAIDLNAELKEKALNSTIDSLKVRNYSFDAAVEDVTKSVTTSRTESRTINFTTTIDVGVAAELGVEVPGGSGVKGGVKFNFRTTIGESKTSSINTTNTVGYVYNDDDDDGDFISFDVGIDPVFGTPVFGNVLGETSCPHEEGTARRDDMEFSVMGSPVRHVPAGQTTAFFDLELGNIGQGQPGEARYFKIYASNVNIPSGITIRSGGSAFPIVTEPPVGYGNNVTIPVEIILSPGSNNYTLEGHEFFVIPECEENILNWYSKSVYLSAYFASPCSDLTMPIPSDNWIVSSTNGNILNVVVDDYNLASNIDEIVLQYGAAGDASWTTSNLVILGSNLSTSPNGTSVNWDVSSLPDGFYKIRWRLKCNGSTFNYSQRRLGIIDRSAPIAFGKPKPTDDNYVSGDIISVKLDQKVDCNALSANDIVMKTFQGNVMIPFQYTCNEDEIVIIPSVDISPNIGTSYIIEIYNLQDEYGNMNPDSVTWNFVVDDLDSDGDGVPDRIDRCPGGNDYYDTDLGGTPDDCDCDPLSAANDGVDDDCDGILNGDDLCPDSSDTALDFDGLDDYVEIQSHPSLNLIDADFTLTAWIYRNPTGNPLTILSKGLGNTQPGDVFIWSIIGHKIALELNLGVLREWQYSNTDVTSNQWVHVAVVYTASTHSATFYLNGVADNTTIYSLAASNNMDSQPMYIGRQGSSCNCNFFSGKLDEISIWNKLLTGPEIVGIMANTPSATASGLLAAYGFNGQKACSANASALTLQDRTNNMHHGTLKNFNLAEGCTSNWAPGSNKIQNCSACLDILQLNATAGFLDGTYTAKSQIVLKPGTLFGVGKNITLDAPTVLFEMDNAVPATTILTIKQDGCPD